MQQAVGESWPPKVGHPVEVASGIVCILAGNPKPYTGDGTNTYLIGDDSVWILDPGPDDSNHIEAVLKAVDGRPVNGICITHTHIDHSGAAKHFKDHTGATTYGFGALDCNIARMTAEAVDTAFSPDMQLRCGDTLGFGVGRLKAIHTPGHFPNHLCYFMPERGILFSGDHVMGWSTTSIVPPLGNMHAYIASLDKLLKLRPALILPSHGPCVPAPLTRLQEIREHRLMRHAQVGQCVHNGITDVIEITKEIYEETLPPWLFEAAKGCVRAHLQLLEENDSEQYDVMFSQMAL